MEPFVYDEKHPHLGGNIDGGDAFTYCPAAWSWMLDKYDIRSVLDVGCAQGHALAFFQSKGCEALGIEGLQSNVDRAVPDVHIIRHDLEVAPFFTAVVDLVWCCEVVEHITKVDNLLTTISNCNMLAMSYAEPGQEGHHHVNCQPREYWIDSLEDYDMVYDPAATVEATSQDKHNNHFSWHGLIFRSKV